MRILAFCLLLTWAFTSCKKKGADVDAPPVYDSTPGPFMQRTIVQLDPTHKDSAWLQLPEHYNSGTDTKKYPLVIYLNGKFESAEYGNLNVMVPIGPPKFMADSLRFAFDTGSKKQEMIVICPQSDNGYKDAADINKVIDYMIAKYRVDVSRIYMTAISSGAGSLLSYVTAKQEYADRLAAIVPMSAVQLTAAEVTNLKFIANSNLPTWIFCGNSDPLLNNNRGYADKINEFKPGLAKFNTYSGAHNNWNRMFSPTNEYYTPNIYQWMLQYSK